MVNDESRDGLHFLHGVPEKRYKKMMSTLAALTLSLHSLVRYHQEGQEQCLINVATKPNTLSSKFYSNS